jgi:tetratricopeptide (TPR) repeat protein
MRVLPIAAFFGATVFAGLAQSQDVSALIKQADALDSQGRPFEAIQLLKQAEKVSPNDPQILIGLSEDYSDAVDASKGESQKLAHAKLCMDYAKRAVEVAPNNANAHVCLAVAYGKMTDFVDNKTKMQYSEVVKSEAEKAIELSPRNDVALFILARWNFDMATLNPILKAFAETLYGQLPPASKEKAVEYFQRAIAIAPDQIMYRAEYAKALESMGRTQEAKVQWQRVAQLKPTGVEDRSYVAEAMKKLR